MLLCPVDTYVHVFLPPERLPFLREQVARTGQVHDVAWIPVDPLVLLGAAATGTVQSLGFHRSGCGTTATAACSG